MPKHEKKLKKMEEERTDALEVAAEAIKEREAQKKDAPNAFCIIRSKEVYKSL